MRYGPFFAGYWKSFVSLAQGAKHCGSELGSVTTFGGAALASPAATNRAIAAATRVRCGIRSLLGLGKARLPLQQSGVRQRASCEPVDPAPGALAPAYSRPCKPTIWRCARPWAAGIVVNACA